MRIDDVTEAQARALRCPFCAAPRGRACSTTTVSRMRADSTLKRSHRKRRQAWLDQRTGEEEP